MRGPARVATRVTIASIAARAASACATWQKGRDQTSDRRLWWWENGEVRVSSHVVPTQSEMGDRLGSRGADTAEPAAPREINHAVVIADLGELGVFSRRLRGA